MHGSLSNLIAEDTGNLDGAGRGHICMYLYMGISYERVRVRGDIDTTLRRELLSFLGVVAPAGTSALATIVLSCVGKGIEKISRRVVVGVQMPLAT